MAQIRRFLTLCLVAGLFGGCTATAERSHDNDCAAAVVHALVAERLLAVRHGLDAGVGVSVDLTAFSDRVDSLAELSGIEAPAGTYFGHLPSPELRSALHLWEAWFQRNEGCLRFDSEAGELRRGPTCPGEGGTRPEPAL